MRALIAGGGTGGHLFPGIAVAEALAALDPSLEIHFAGTRYGIESRIIPLTAWPLHCLAVRGMPRRPSLAMVGAAARIPVSLAQAAALIGRLRPRFVVGTGGYASAPAVVAASIAGVPVALLEQNLAPGWTTRSLAPLAREVHVSFPETAAQLSRARRVIVSGNPVRRDVLSARRGDALPHFGFDPSRRTLLVIGGSRGALGLNALAAGALREMEPDPSWQCLFQSGAEDEATVRATLAPLGSRVVVRAFVEEMGLAYASADLVIARAGATTVAELTARGLPAILVPYPWAAAAHQEENARWMASRGAAIVVPERGSSPADLAARIAPFFRDPPALATFAAASASLGKPRAAMTVAAAVLSL